MSRYCGGKWIIEETLIAAQKWRDECLKNNGSMFTDRDIWNTENTEQLVKYFINNVDNSDRSFFDKLKDQLVPATNDAKLFAAEMLWVMFLCPSNIKPPKKIKNILTVFNWTNVTVPDGHELFSFEVLKGVGSAGPGYNQNRWMEFSYFIRFLNSFLSLSKQDRSALLNDGFNFSKWCESIEGNDKRQFRHMLLYLLFPDRYERIFGASDRIKIAASFAKHARSEITNMSARELDQLLSGIREEQELIYNTKDLDWYNPPLNEKWSRTEESKPTVDRVLTRDHVIKALSEIDVRGIGPNEYSSTYDLIYKENRYPPKLVYAIAHKYAGNKELDRSTFHGGENTECFNTLRKLGFVIEKKNNVVNEPAVPNTNYSVRYWIIAPGEGARRWDEFYDAGIVGLGWDEIGDLSRYKVRDEIREVLIKTYPGGSKARTNDSLALWQFYSEMKPGDILIPKKGTNEYLGYGVVSSDYYYDDLRDEFKHVRKIDWKAKGIWHEEHGPIVLKTLTDITKYSDYVEKLKTQIGISDEIKYVKEPMVSYEKYVIDDALKDVFVGEEQLKNIVSRLANKKNIILQGPPGTGKTYIAKRLAYLLFGEKDTSRVAMVQFHQSYSYEDFIQGYRPDSTGFI